LWLWQCLVPHPPIIIPEVGQGREKEASKTIDAMEALARSISDFAPENIFLLTPHSDYTNGLCILSAEQYRGDLSMFGHQEVFLSFQGNRKMAESIRGILASGEIPVNIFFNEEIFLDHASLIPLYFLSRYWDKKPNIIVANPIGLSPQEALAAGKLLANVDTGTSLGMIASGDLSHRLTPDAPAGFHKDGAVFDHLLVQSLKENNPDIIMHADKGIFVNAGECGLKSALFFMGCAEKGKIDVLSYEGPFGVGYCVAKSDKIQGVQDKDQYVAIAKSAITSYLKRLPLHKSTSPKGSATLLDKPGACFVSLKDKNGRLRGCIGTVSPQQETLAYEIEINAISAATRDPRFPPVTLAELEGLAASVDILTEPEKIENEDGLDVKKYGIIVEKGHRRGVLLPDLEGVTCVEQQIRIAALKAGISDLNGSVIYRFQVERHSAKELL